MDSKGIVLFILVLMLSVFAYNAFTGRCNEAVCASIVTKCMLTQACKCDAKNTSCCKDCFYCLDKLYLECCSCVDMCPKDKDSESYLSTKSHVEELAEPFDELFCALTEDEDRLLRWTSYTFPVELTIISMNKEMKYVPAKTGDSAEPVNCTVAYMSDCFSWSKCKIACSSMGASSYRWFHDGCCECVGFTCVNYGINESRCLDCPPGKDEMTVDELHVLTKDSEEIDDEYTEYQYEDTLDSAPANEDEKVDDIQTVDS